VSNHEDEIRFVENMAVRGATTGIVEHLPFANKQHACAKCLRLDVYEK
jgi:hypothetical protein